MKRIVYLNDQPFLNESAVAKYAQDLQPLNCSISLLTNFIYDGGSYLSKVTNKIHFKVVAVGYWMLGTNLPTIHVPSLDYSVGEESTSCCLCKLLLTIKH